MTTVRARHLGAAGWELIAGQTTILLDPYLSRLRYRFRFGTLDTPALPGDMRRIFGPDDELVPDTAAIDTHVTRADFILHSHSHFNHTLDMPHIARKTGAVVGTESTINLARAGSVPEAQFVAVRGGEDPEFGALSVKVVPSLHSALNGKHYFDSRVVARSSSWCRNARFSNTRERWVLTPRRRPVRMRVIMPAIIDQAGRKSTLTRRTE